MIKNLESSEQTKAERAAARDQPKVRGWPKLGDTVTVQYIGKNWECEIEIPINDKSKQAKLGNGMGLAMLAYGATVRSI